MLAVILELVPSLSLPCFLNLLLCIRSGNPNIALSLALDVFGCELARLLREVSLNEGF